MKKLIALIISALVLGAGIWISQNPQGTMEDLKTQSLATVDRLKLGVDAVVAASPAAIQSLRSEQASEREKFLERIEKLETQVAESLLTQSEQSLVGESSASGDSANINTEISVITNRLNVLSESLDEINAKVNQQLVDTEAKQQSIVQANEGIEQVVQQQTNLDSLVNELQTSIESLQQATTESDDQSTIETLSASLTALQNQQQSLIQQVAEQKTQFENSNATLTEIQQSLQLTRATVESMPTTEEAGAQSFSELREELDSLQTRVLNDREAFMAQLDQATNSQKELINNLGTQLDSLKNDFVDQSQLAIALEKLESERQNSIEFNETTRLSLQEALAAVADRAETINRRLDTLSAAASVAQVSSNSDAGDDEAGTVNTQEQALAALSVGLDERFNAIEQQLSTVNSDSRQLASLTERLTALSNDLGSIETEVNTLKEAANATKESVSTINTSLTELNNAEEPLSIEDVQAEIESQLQQLQASLESRLAEDKNEEIVALLDATRTRIESLEEQVQELPDPEAEAEESAAAIQASLEAQIIALENRLESISQTNPEIEEQIKALESRLETVNQTDPEIESVLSSVKEQVAQLSSQSFVTREDLRAQAETRSNEYKIYFDRNSTEITEDAAQVLNSFITQEKNRTTGVTIFGFTDRRGSAIYNEQLALQRAINVRSYLLQNGLDFTKIKGLTGLGEDAAAAILPDDAEDAQQRVVIIYADQP